MITGCLKPTNINSLPLNAGISPSDIRRAVASRTERAQQTTDQRHPLNGHRRCHTWNHTRASSNALSPSTRRRKPLAWSYGENDSSPWMPVCTLTSVLTNTFQLAQRFPGQPGRHWTGCVHRLAGQEWTCQSGAIQTKQRLLTVASGRLCNTYWSASWWTLPALPMTWQWLMASPSAVPGIGRAQFDWNATGGRTRMMMIL